MIGLENDWPWPKRHSDLTRKPPSIKKNGFYCGISFLTGRGFWGVKFTFENMLSWIKERHSFIRDTQWQHVSFCVFLQYAYKYIPSKLWLLTVYVQFQDMRILRFWFVNIPLKFIGWNSQPLILNRHWFWLLWVRILHMLTFPWDLSIQLTNVGQTFLERLIFLKAQNEVGGKKFKLDWNPQVICEKNLRSSTCQVS